ncbi:MAG: TonB-dependent siderophore receptor [Oceanipulchritudo sp.]
MMKPTHTLLFPRWLAIALVLGMNPANGQDAEAAEVFELSAFEVRAQEDYGYRAINSMTATRIGMELIQVPLSVQVVTEEFIQDLGLASFADSLRYVSSSVGDTLSTAGESGNAYIRGFPTAWTLRNGFRRYRGMVTENADRVEIVKGPVSVFFGQAAPGGITNIITKRPDFFNHGSVKATYGSYDYKKTSLEYNQVLVKDVLAARLYTSYEDREDWKDYEWKEATYVAPSLKWRPTSGTEVIFEYEYFASEENKANSALYASQEAFDAYLNPPAELLAKYSGNLELLQRIFRFNVNQWEVEYKSVGLTVPQDRARYTPELSPSGWGWNGNGPGAKISYDSEDYIFELKQKLASWFELRAGVNFASSNSLDYRFHSADRPYPDGSIDLIRGNDGKYAENDTLTVQMDGLFRFQIGKTKHSILAGIERVEDDFRQAPALFDYNLAAGHIIPAPDPYGFDRKTIQDMYRRYYPFFDPVQPGAGIVFNGYSDGWFRDESASRRGYYLNHQGEFLSGRLNTMVGARREKFTIEGTGTAETAYADNVFMGGFSFKLIEGLNFFSSYSQNFEPNRPPNNVNISGPGVLPGEASLLPPRSGEGIDIGLKSALWDNKLSGMISFFNLQQESTVARDDEKTENDPRNLDDDPANDVTWFRTAGLYESEGLEVELVYSPTPNYQLVCSFSWMWTAALVEDPNLPPDHGLFDRRNQNSPEYKFTVWNKYVFGEGPMEGLEIGFGARFVDDHFPRSGLGSTQLLVNDSSLVFDGLIAYKTRIAGLDTRFALQLENLTDEVYQEGHTAAGDPFKANFSVKVDF